VSHWALWTIIVLYSLGLIIRWVSLLKTSDTYGKVMGVLLAIVVDVVIIAFAVMETLHM
jgi:hypothetical protein